MNSENEDNLRRFLNDHPSGATIPPPTGGGSEIIVKGLHYDEFGDGNVVGLRVTGILADADGDGTVQGVHAAAEGQYLRRAFNSGGPVVYEFGNPPGGTGPAGPPGATGPAGPAGPAGPQGVPGPSGAFAPNVKGILVDKLGNNIFSGAQVTGIVANPTGDNNLVGIASSVTGEVLTKVASGYAFQPLPLISGPQGPQGPQGIPGPTGPVGPTGPQGPAGTGGSGGFTPNVTGFLLDRTGTNTFSGVASSVAGYFLKRKMNSAGSPDYGFAPGVELNSRDFNFTATYAVNLIVGGNTLFGGSSIGHPAGINDYSTGRHYLLITDAVAGNEVVLVAGVNTAAGHIAFTCALAHTAGNWTLSSATAGIQEAHYYGIINADADQAYPWMYTRGVRIPAGHFVVSQIFICTPYAEFDGQISFRGESIWTTTLLARTTTQNIFFWANNFAPSINVLTHVNIADMRLRSSPDGSQTAGAMIHLSGNHRVEIVNCSFWECYDCVYIPSWSAMVRCHGLFANGVKRHFIYLSGSPAGNIGNACVFQLQYCYCDAVLSTAMIKIRGLNAGGIITNMWLQAAARTFHIFSDATTGPNNEILIANCIIDQDRAGTIENILLESNNVSNSSNTVKIVGNYISTPAYCLVARNYANIEVNGNFMKSKQSPALISLTNCTNSQIMNNKMVDESRVAQTYIDLVATVPGHFRFLNIKGNVAHSFQSSGTNTASFVRLNITASILGPIMITDNTLDTIAAIVSPGGFAGREQVFIRNNQIPSYTPNAINAAGTISVPWDDDSSIVAINNGGATITRLLGGQVGMKRTFIAGTANTDFMPGGGAGGFATSGSKLLNTAYTLTYYPPTGLWYLSS